MDVAQRRFALLGMLVAHRYGMIAPSEPIVFVATAALHRRAAFEALDFMMDQLKSATPFWKKEHGAAGAHWIEPADADKADALRWNGI
jgi:molybdopterin synthase catalytic subunit